MRSKCFLLRVSSGMLCVMQVACDEEVRGWYFLFHSFHSFLSFFMEF